MRQNAFWGSIGCAWKWRETAFASHRLAWASALLLSAGRPEIPTDQHQNGNVLRQKG